MRPHICPQCEAWRVQRRDVGRVQRSFCLAFNLNPYRCGGCGWEGLRWEGEGKGWKKILLAPSTLARLAIVLLVFAGILYGASFLKEDPEEKGETARESPVVEPAPVPAVVEVPPPLVVPSAPPPVREKAEIAPPLRTAPQGIAASGATVTAKRKTIVVGNRDSKRYHLPGMKYYDQVKAYHRVEFSSEEEAIAAGYHRAPR